jgi:hypothetical protein
MAANPQPTLESHNFARDASTNPKCNKPNCPRRGRNMWRGDRFPVGVKGREGAVEREEFKCVPGKPYRAHYVYRVAGQDAVRLGAGRFRFRDPITGEDLETQSGHAAAVAKRVPQIRAQMQDKPEVKQRHTEGTTRGRLKGNTERQRRKNLEGLEIQTGLRISLIAHRLVEGLKPYTMKDEIYPDAKDSHDSIKKALANHDVKIQDEKKRVAALPDEVGRTEAEDLSRRLRQTLGLGELKFPQ